MSRQPEQETFAELTRLPKPDSLKAANQHARKMIAAVAKEAGIINADYNNIEAAQAIREIIDDALPRTRPMIEPTAERPTLPDELRAPSSSAPVTRDRFKPRALNPQQLERVVAIRAAFQAVEDVVTHVTAPGRFQSLVLTALEEACMWAVKAVSHENG